MEQRVVDKEIKYLGESDFSQRMEEEVIPYLKKYKKHGVFSSYDTSNLYYETYKLPTSKGSIVISHGFCEFSAKFYEVIYQFLQGGYSVYILDHRGHGKSKRFVEDMGMVHIDSYEEYIKDLHAFFHTIVKTTSNSSNYILYGHSMGGAIAALYLETYPEDFTMGILTSPMLQINFGKLPELFVHAVSTYSRIRQKGKEYVMGHSGFDGKYEHETSSSKSRARYDYVFHLRENNEHYQTYGANYHWTIASILAIRQIQKNAKNIKVPVLLFQAENDSLVKAKGQNKFIKNVAHGKKVFVPNSKHEIYNEELEVRKKYFNRMFEFIEENTKKQGD